MPARNTPTVDEQREQAERELRAERHAQAHNVNPWAAGDELLDGSDAREAKLKAAREGEAERKRAEQVKK